MSQPDNTKKRFKERTLSFMLEYDTLILRIHVDKEPNVLMFCPICLDLCNFEMQYPTVPETGKELIIAQCKRCYSLFGEGNYIMYSKSEPPRSLRQLMELNQDLSYYQKETGTKVIEIDTNYEGIEKLK